jgi:hypothetical protein
MTYESQLPFATQLAGLHQQTFQEQQNRLAQQNMANQQIQAERQARADAAVQAMNHAGLQNQFQSQQNDLQRQAGLEEHAMGTFGKMYEDWTKKKESVDQAAYEQALREFKNDPNAPGLNDRYETIRGGLAKTLPPEPDYGAFRGKMGLGGKPALPQAGPATMNVIGDEQAGVGRQYQLGGQPSGKAPSPGARIDPVGAGVGTQGGTPLLAAMQTGAPRPPPQVFSQTPTPQATAAPIQSAGVAGRPAPPPVKVIPPQMRSPADLQSPFLGQKDEHGNQIGGALTSDRTAIMPTAFYKAMESLNRPDRPLLPKEKELIMSGLRGQFPRTEDWLHAVQPVAESVMNEANRHGFGGVGHWQIQRDPSGATIFNPAYSHPFYQSRIGAGASNFGATVGNALRSAGVKQPLSTSELESLQKAFEFLTGTEQR